MTRIACLALLLVAALCGPAAGAANAAANQTPTTKPVITYRFGPIDLAAYETSRGNEPVRTPEIDGFLTGMYAHIVDAAGRPVPQQRVMLHHVLFSNVGRFRGDRTSSDCKGVSPHEKFYGTGEEDQELQLPGGYGYRLRAKDGWRLSWMFMNHTAKAERVYLEYRMTVSEDGSLTPVIPYWVSIGCSSGKSFNVPGGGAPGSKYQRSRRWTVPRNGRIVAGAAHAHGGVYGIGLTDEACGSRPLLSSDALYGSADDPIYQFKPQLHEPSPRSMSLVTSATGWRVSRGDVLNLTASYDTERPHSGVMGIMHVYLAPGGGRPVPCPDLPADVQTHRLAFPGTPGRSVPPAVTVELSERDANGVAQPLTTLPGRFSFRTGDADVVVDDFAFSPRKLSVPAGAKITWRFNDRTVHDVTLAAGPRALASRYLNHGIRYSRALTVPGEYRLFCSLHSVDMSQIIEVRPPG